MLVDTIKKANDIQSNRLKEDIILNSDREFTNEEATNMLATSMKESYLSSLEMIQAFSFGNWKDAEEALDIPEDKDAGMIIGALLGHTRSIFEYISEHTGMSSREVMQGYGYYFYSNVLTDLEDMFTATSHVMNEVDMLEELIGDENDKD